MQLLRACVLMLAVLLLADARKSKKAKAKAHRRPNTGNADWQTLLRADDGRRAVDALLARAAGISGGGVALRQEPTEAVVARTLAATTDEWELYSLGASLLHEYSGDQGAVKLGLGLLAHVAGSGGQAATPAGEVSMGAKHKVMSNMMPCKEKGPGSPDCRPFSTLPLPPHPGEKARVRRAVDGWVGERLNGAAIGETISEDGADTDRMAITLLSREPFVATITGFITPDEAEQLVATAGAAISSRVPGGDLCVKPEREQSLARVSTAQSTHRTRHRAASPFRAVVRSRKFVYLFNQSVACFCTGSGAGWKGWGREPTQLDMLSSVSRWRGLPCNEHLNPGETHAASSLTRACILSPHRIEDCCC
jgi:hypothetical protein